MNQCFQIEPHPYFSSLFWSPLSQLPTGNLKWHKLLASYFYRDYGSNILTLNSVYMDQYFQSEHHTYYSSAFWSPLSPLMTGILKWHQPSAFYFYRNYGSNYLTSNSVYMDQYLQSVTHNYFSTASWSQLGLLLTGNLKWQQPLALFFYRLWIKSNDV